MRFFLPALLLTACGTVVSTTPVDVPTTWNKDIEPIVAARCAGCHVAGGIAPILFDTYALGLKWKDAMRAAVETRRMPPYLAGPGCAAYVDDQRLTQTEIAAFGKWVDSGAAEGDASQVRQHVDTPVAPGLPRVDLTLKMADVFTPTLIPDEYRCFVLDWPKTTDSYAVGMQVVPGNARVVHHVIAFVIPPEQVAAVQKLDDAEQGPGYSCFGGAGVGGRPSWLGAWAPGGKPSMYPPGTGLAVKAGSKNWVLRPRLCSEIERVDGGLSSTG